MNHDRPAADIDAALRSIEAEVRRCWAATGFVAAVSGQGRLAAAVGLLGDRLACGSDDPVDVAGATLRRRFGTIRLPRHERPGTSAIFHARPDVAATLGLLAGVGALAGETAAEAVVLDDGRDPRTSVIRTLAPNAVHLDVRAESGARAVNLAASLSRGAWLALLDEAAGAASVALLAIQTRQPGTVVAGPAVAEAARHCGMAEALAPREKAPAPKGLTLWIAAEVFASLGGLDPAVEGGDVYAALDLCLRARRAGLDVRCLEQRPAFGAHATARPTAGVRESLRARWADAADSGIDC